jgi:hypothetical protein
MRSAELSKLWSARYREQWEGPELSLHGGRGAAGAVGAGGDAQKFAHRANVEAAWCRTRWGPAVAAAAAAAECVERLLRSGIWLLSHHPAA